MRFTIDGRFVLSTTKDLVLSRAGVIVKYPVIVVDNVLVELPSLRYDWELLLHDSIPVRSIFRDLALCAAYWLAVDSKFSDFSRPRFNT